MKELLRSMIIDAVKCMYAELKVAPSKGSWNSMTSTKIPSTYDVVKKYKTIFATISAIADSFGDENIKAMVKTASDKLPEAEEENILGL